jgi:hypothetical protein
MRCPKRATRRGVSLSSRSSALDLGSCSVVRRRRAEWTVDTSARIWRTADVAPGRSRRGHRAHGKGCHRAEGGRRVDARCVILVDGPVHVPSTDGRCHAARHRCRSERRLVFRGTGALPRTEQVCEARAMTFDAKWRSRSRLAFPRSPASSSACARRSVIRSHVTSLEARVPALRCADLRGELVAARGMHPSQLSAGVAAEVPAATPNDPRTSARRRPRRVPAGDRRGRPAARAPSRLDSEDRVKSRDVVYLGCAGCSGEVGNGPGPGSAT